MKKKVLFLCVLVLFAVFSVPTTGCSPKYGCPAYESTHAPVNRKGELSSKRGNSNLFPKQMRKK